MSVLLLDAGNSRLKVAEWTSEPMDVHVFAYRDFPSNLALFSQLENQWENIEALYVANVAGQAFAGELVMFCQQKGIAIELAQSQREMCGLVNAYVSPEQLGVDRWLSMVAATHCFKKPVCIVSCGTAVTIDQVDNGGQHKGGVILPGIHLMRSAINNQTGAIKIDNLDFSPARLGKNTEQAISSGILYSIARLIDWHCDEFTAEYGQDAECVLTGGDAVIIQPLLNVQTINKQNMVLEGLAISYGLTK